MMKQRNRVILALFLLVCVLNLTGVAFAEDGENYGRFINGQYVPGEWEGENPSEEIGGFFGWLTIAIAAGAGGLFVFRRILGKFKNATPEMKDLLKGGARLLRKWHIPIGFIAVAVAGVHGTLMYLNGEGLGLNEWTGIASIGVALLATVIGIVLAMKKKMSIEIRRFHSSAMLVSGILAVLHLLID